MAITFEDIKRANDAIATIDVKGKEYAEVNQRIKVFRMVYPQGFIVTDMISNVDGVCVFTAKVGYYTEDNQPCVIGCGTAYEKEGSTFINRTSYIENCETSAVGRALGMAGFGIDTSVASAEEVQNAILNQDDESKATRTQIQVIEKYYTGDNLTMLLQSNGIDKLEDLPKSKATEIMRKLNEMGRA